MTSSRLAQLTLLGLSLNAVFEITLLVLTLVAPRAGDGAAAQVGTLAGTLEHGAYILLLLSMSYTGVVWMSWQYQVVKKALGLGVAVGTGPGLSVAAWFIPGFNLFRPYQVIRNLCRGSSGNQSRVIVLAWWVSALLSNIWFFAINFTLLASTLTATPVKVGPAFPLFVAAQYLLLAVAEVLSIILVRRIQRG